MQIMIVALQENLLFWASNLEAESHPITHLVFSVTQKAPDQYKSENVEKMKQKNNCVLTNQVQSTSHRHETIETAKQNLQFIQCCEA
jgi:hypothetical protein